MALTNTTNPSLPPYPGREFIYAMWRGAWHKAIWHHVPQAMRIGGVRLDWLVRQCDGFDGDPDRVKHKREFKQRETPPAKTARKCKKCFA